MLTQKTLYFVIILFTVFGITGCEKDIQIQESDLIGTWRCLGFGDTGTWNFRAIEDKGCSQCFLLAFNEDNTVRGVTLANTLQGEFEISSDNTFQFANLISTEVYEEGDAVYFSQSLLKVNEYEIRGKQLLLYYEGDQYLLFEQEN